MADWTREDYLLAGLGRARLPHSDCGWRGVPGPANGRHHLSGVDRYEDTWMGLTEYPPTTAPEIMAAHYRQLVIAQLTPVLGANFTDSIRDKYEQLIRPG